MPVADPDLGDVLAACAGAYLALLLDRLDRPLPDRPAVSRDLAGAVLPRGDFERFLRECLEREDGLR